MTKHPLRATISQRGVVFGPNNAVLVVQRATDSGWELPGGRVGAKENAVAGLRREITEETALVPDVITPVHTLTWRNADDNGRFAVYYYCLSNSQSVLLSTEHNDHEWVGPARAYSRLSDPQGAAVKEALATHRTKSPERTEQ